MIANIFQEDFFVHTIIPRERAIDCGLPLKEIGYLDAVRVRKDLIYDDMLEITIRLESEEEMAVDYLDGVRYETPFPHVLIKKPGVHHAYTAALPRKAFFIQYYPSAVEVLEKAGVKFDPLVWRITLTESLMNKVGELLKISALINQPMMREKADMLGWGLMLELLDFRQRDLLEDERFHKFQEIASYLQIHYLTVTNMAKLAHKYGMSERTFYRFWRQYNPESPMEMINRLKLEFAKNRLLFSDRSISEIAAALGYSTIYFERFFKRHTGKTPGAFRRQSS